jgi:hypothetical protein
MTHARVEAAKNSRNAVADNMKTGRLRFDGLFSCVPHPRQGREMGADAKPGSENNWRLY